MHYVNTKSKSRSSSTAKPSLKHRLKVLFREYGLIALLTHAVISILFIAGFSVAIGVTVAPTTAAGVVGVVVAGWAAQQPTVPFRPVITLALTPLVARMLRRRRRAAVGTPR